MKSIVSILLFFINVTIAISQPNLLWQKTLGGSERETAYSVISTKDGGCVVCIESESNDGDVTKIGTYSDYWIVKLKQDGNIEWQKSFEGNGSDRPLCIIESHDGGFVIAGGTHIVENDIIDNSGNWDAWMIKISNKGILEWEKKYGGMFTDGAIGITNTIDKGFCFVGVNTSNTATGYDAWIVRMSSLGDHRWSKILKGNQDDRFINVKETSDSGLLCVGYSSSTTGSFGEGFGEDDGLLVKFDKSGNQLGYKRYGRNKSDILRDVVQLDNGKILAIGFSESYADQISPPSNEPCIWAIMTDIGGKVLWEKIFPSKFGTNYGYSIKKINNNSFIIAGGGFKNDMDSRLLKIDTNGVLMWDVYYGGSNEDMAYSVDISDNNSVYMAGYTFSSDGNITNNKGASDAWIIKLQMNDSLISSVYKEFSLPIVVPNPVSNDFHLNVEIESEDIFTIKLISVDGNICKHVFEGNLQTGTRSLTISTSDLSSGTYFCIIKNTKGLRTQKVLIVK